MQQQNPLEELVVSVLNENGFGKLDEDAKKTYLPQFIAQAEQRLGAAMLPLLGEQSANEFVKLTKKETSSDEWYGFWKKNVPNFDLVVKKTLKDFASEVSGAFQV
jgi:predicted methyltransferase